MKFKIYGYDNKATFKHTAEVYRIFDNRKVIGSELNEEYFEIIKDRFKG